MFRPLLAVAAAVALAAPAAAVDFSTALAASKGLQAMRELNLIVFKDLASSNEVEGKTFVGGNVSGQSEQFGIGNATEGFYRNDARATLTVGGNLDIAAKLNNGPTKDMSKKPVVGMNVSGNGSPAITDSRIDVGGNLTGSVSPNTSTSLVRTGGSFNGSNYNPDPNKTAKYGTTVSGIQAQDAQYVTKDTSLAPNAQGTGLAQVIANQTAELRTNLTALSTVLGGLTANATLNITNGSDIHFDYSASATNAQYAVATISAATLAGLNSNWDFNFNLLADSSTITGFKTTVINVTGIGASGNYIFRNKNNDNQHSNDQNLIWNFIAPANSTASIEFDVNEHGSILAPNLTFANPTTQVNGTVVASMFTQGGEVHLGTFAGTAAIAPAPAVPEPATWATMLAGFGVVGAAMRRRRPATACS